MIDISTESVKKPYLHNISVELKDSNPQNNNVELNSHENNVELPITHLPNGKFAPGNNAGPNGRGLGTPNSYRLGEPITQETLNKLETFSKPQLIALIKKVSGSIWGVGIMSDDEAYEAVRLKLLHTGLTSESANSSLNVLKEWTDRTKGKAAQSISMKVEIDPIQKMSTERLLKLEQSLAKITGQDALVIPPMPEKLGDNE